MRGKMKSRVHKAFRAFGLNITRHRRQEAVFPPDFRKEEVEIIRAVEPWTMTSAERIFALIQAVRYVSVNAIPGALVECGVWKGGSMAAAAMTLVWANDLKRDLYLFDTFAGMTEPTTRDLDYADRPAKRLLTEESRFRCDDAPLHVVEEILEGTGYPKDKIHLVRGRVEETIPSSAPEAISMLRLDTDWYESTKHELIHLFPRLSRGGVLLIDDYGHWKGAREASDEYFAENQIPILLSRIDYTGRMAVKL